MTLLRRGLCGAGLVLLAAVLCSQPGVREQVGPLPDGGFLLNSGWKIRPTGVQIPVDTLPMSSALSRDGRYLLVLNGGYRPPSISVIDLQTTAETSRTPVPDGWFGLAISPKGDRVYVGGGSRASVFEFTFAGGALRATRTFVVVPEGKRTHQDFIGDVTLSPDGRLLYAADLYRDSIVVINPQSGMTIDRFKTGRRPYRILFHPDGKSFFVTSWTDGALGHYDTATGARLAALRIGPHATDMIWVEGKVEPAEGEPGRVARLFVTASNTNNVYAVGVTEAKELRLLESINTAMTPRQPLGMTPTALASSNDRKRLYIACSNANAVAVADISQERSSVSGFLPAGWYPTGVRELPDGRVAVLNGRGVRSYPNPQGPVPTRRKSPLHEGQVEPQYVGRMQTGTVSMIPRFGDEQLDGYTKSVLANSPYSDVKLDDAGTGEGSPIPSHAGEVSPIEHVIYIIKENRTYDQVLGDMKEGNGDASLLLFGERITPNLHKLAREFVLLDNFYVNSDVSADGHNWSTAAIAPDYVEKMWQNSYAKRRQHYDYECQEPTANPPAGYIWSNAAEAGLTVRNYGYCATNKPAAEPGGVQLERVRDPVLSRVTNDRYRAFDLDYPDVERARVFLSDLAEFDKTGAMPRLMLLRLGNDHTSGTTPGKIAPFSAVADNDYALGMIVEAVSRSRFWPKTAIFVLEDDAQNGADHVDSHRSLAFVISPYVKRKAVDSTMYNTTSVLRTMELILGLRPMTHFDAAARPMSGAFQPTPVLTPYTAEQPRVPLTDRNPATAPEAARSERMDFSDADRIDDDELNEILWTAIRGTDPPPVTASFFSPRRRAPSSSR
jgi:DNA-binding beta-propeller fold protein YncE